MRLNLMQMKKQAEEAEFAAGRELADTGCVRLTEQGTGYVKYVVAGIPQQTVTIGRELSVRCSCDAFAKQKVCRHVVAAAAEAERTGVPDQLLRISAGEQAEKLTGIILYAMPREATIRLEITLVLPARKEECLRLGLRVGENKLYVVRDILSFLDAVERRETLAFGQGFVYQPEVMRFSPEDEAVLTVARKLLILRRREEKATAIRLLPLPEDFVKELLPLLENRSFRIMDPGGSIKTCTSLKEVRLPLQFEMNLTPRGLSVTGRIPVDFQPLTSDCAWALLGGEIVRVSGDQRELSRLMEGAQYEGKCLFSWPLRDTEQVIGEVFPFLKLRGAVEMSEDLRRRLVRLPLKTEIYLDRDGKSIVGQVRFCYGQISLNPFAPEKEKIALEKGEKLLLRDAEGEHVPLELLAGAGFLVRKDQIRLSGSDEIFDFVNEGVKKLQDVADVFLSREFKRILPRRPNLKGSMRMNGEQLRFMLEADGEPVEEVLELMEALSRRRRYYRLKTGEFLDLQDLAEWQETAAAVYEAAVRDGNELNRDAIVLRAYRAWYLNSMLENSRLKISRDAQMQAMSSIPGETEKIQTPELAPGIELKAYQKRGYEWMYALDQMHMGGILADDMGLGKTVQVIALLKTARVPGRVSLVVAPTSLTYNWLSEIRHFAPDLTAAVASGAGNRREGLIRHALEHGDVDVLISSYPLIRRDIELMKEYPFRFVILDEAQNIKNAGSVAASAVKQLKADTRFALTGTPMENGIGELWSIFDFVLPGYLPGYNTFLRRYQDGENSEDLLRRIRPFLTRRLKQDVLEELPDKLESTLTARMTPEQERIYRAALERLRPRVDQILDTKGLGQGKMEVLSAITELREICCHPGLVMTDYRGGSGKEDLLMELLPGMIGAGGRVLIFSQFTSMLKLLRPRLEEAGFRVLYLDGNTPAGERLELAERFNGGEGDIFLISLRAGGSGLNLTGADTVIHYDPWWNPATEEQATDRAHRIGQTKKVQVFRLVTGESIEEQVVELGLRKKALFDQLITPGESGLSVLSEQDIRNLFN